MKTNSRDILESIPPAVQFHCAKPATHRISELMGSVNAAASDIVVLSLRIKTALSELTALLENGKRWHAAGPKTGPCNSIRPLEQIKNARKEEKGRTVIDRCLRQTEKNLHLFERKEH